MIEIPDGFAQSTIAREGDPGRTWLVELPWLIDEFLQTWNCRPAAPITHGQVGVVLPVRRRDGSAAVLKISFPHPGNVLEPRFLALWGGHGAVQLHERDDARFAMLLEHAGPDTVARLGDDEAIAISGELARRLAIPAPPDLPRLSDQAREWEEAVLKNAARPDHPLPRPTIDAAVATIRQLCRSQPQTLVHGDLHYGNILRAGRGTWLVIDPKGHVGDPAFEGITVLVGGVHRLPAAGDLRRELLRRLSIFAEAAELDRADVIRWVQARAVVESQQARERGAPAWEIQTIERFAVALT